MSDAETPEGPSEPLAAPAGPRDGTAESRIVLRRALSLMLDLSALTTASDWITNQIAVPAPRALMNLIETAIAFAWWSAPAWGSYAGTPGMFLTGLVLRDPSGGPAPRAALLRRALFFTVLFSANLAELANSLTGGRLPDAWKLLEPGVTIGYVVHALLALRSRPGEPLLHERWSGTRVARKGAEPRAATATAAPGSTRLLWALVAGGIVGLAFGCVGDAGFDPRALWTATRPVTRLDRRLEQRLADRMHVRSEVALVHKVRWSSEHPRQDVLEIRARIPWAAWSDEKVEAYRAILFDSLSINPHYYRRLELHIGCSLEGLLRLKLDYNQTWEYDSLRKEWAAPRHDKA